MVYYWQESGLRIQYYYYLGSFGIQREMQGRVSVGRCIESTLLKWCVAHVHVHT